MRPVFDSIAEAYDRWYDTPEARAIFRAERDCLIALHHGLFDSWLEVGVGTGRFASALKIPTGIDPSPNMLLIAAKRGIKTYLCEASRLPFVKASFDGVLIALTLCFVANTREVLQEIRRVLRPGGHLLIGIIPADSAWGRSYQEKAAQRHPVYSHAHFRRSIEVMKLVKSTGFSLIDSASTLFWSPGEEPEAVPLIEKGIIPGAGFIGMLFQIPL